MRRALLRAFVAGMLLAGAAAAPAQAETRLSFPCWQTEEPGFRDWWKEVVVAFEAKYPGVKVDMRQVPFPDYINTLTIQFASNRPPDILMLPSDAFGAFASQGWLDPLDARVKGTAYADPAQWSSMQSQLVWDGKTQGVLLMGYGFMMFYNEQLLQKAGVPVPTSFAPYTESIGKITDRASGIFGLAAVTTEHPAIGVDFVRFIRWQGQELIKDGRYNLTSPGVVKAIETYRTVVGGNSALGANSTLARQLFVDGKTGFLVDGPWVWVRAQTATDAVRPHLKMVPAPFPPALGGAANSMHIPAALPADRKELVWKFIEVLTSPELQRRYLLITASPPGRQNVLTAEDRAANPHLVSIVEAARGAQPFNPTEQTVQANINEFTAILRRAALKVLSTTEPVAGILKEAQRELELAVPLS